MQIHNTLPKYVTIRPYLHPNHYLFIANDKSRGHRQDYDVRIHKSVEDRNYIILEHQHQNTYRIVSYTNKDHYVFCSNDGERGFQQDYDVRSHAYGNEQRNNWIIEKVAWHTYTIRSETNQNHFLFYADDNTNLFNQDWDVRTHTQQTDNNLWIIDNFYVNVKEENQVQPQNFVPFSPVTVKSYNLRASQNPNQMLSQAVFEAKAQSQLGHNCHFHIDKVFGNIFTIRPTACSGYYLILENDKHCNQWKDYAVSFKHFNDKRSHWIIEKVGENKFTIKSAVDPSYFLFAVIEGNQQAFDVRAHAFAEERNAWIIEGLVI